MSHLNVFHAFPRDKITVMHNPSFEHFDTRSFGLPACIILYIIGKQFRCSVFTFVQYSLIISCHCYNKLEKIPSVSCETISFRSFIVLLLIIFCLGQFEKFCISVNIKQKKYTRHLQHKKIVYGLTHYMNVTFTKTCIISLMCSNLFVLFLILKLSGDIHPNPGPQSDSLLSSNISTVFPHNLNILFLNIQSILLKIDLLEAEVQNYDILVFT